MKATNVAAAAAVFGAASAMHCVNVTVPVHASARNGVFEVKAPTSNIEVTNFILNLGRQGGNYTKDELKGYKTVSGSYSLAGTYCVPTQKASGYGQSGQTKTVQLLTHGIGFDRSYWNLPFNSGNYSYSAVATDKYGYATFSWDRLGIGMSSHGDPINEIQAPLEVDALRALTEALRCGSVPGVPKFEKVVHVGHSFGSTHTYALTAKYPGISDGIALTGFSQNGTFMPFFEYGGNFVKVPAGKPYVDGYFAAGDASAVQTNFFSPNSFDPKILDFATMTGQPVTIGELFTIGGETADPNPFPGSVLVVTGERDIPFCGGNCLAAPTGFASIPETSKKMFAKAKDFKVVIVPGAGHGLNLEYSHPFTYDQVNQHFAQTVPAQ